MYRKVIGKIFKDFFIVKKNELLIFINFLSFRKGIVFSVFFRDLVNNKFIFIDWVK